MVVVRDEVGAIEEAHRERRDALRHPALELHAARNSASTPAAARAPAPSGCAREAGRRRPPRVRIFAALRGKGGER